MAVFTPFRALMPTPEKVASVSAVPYDVVNTEEAAALAEGNPLSFLRVSRPEIELEPGIDLHDDKVYAKAAANFQRLIEQAPLTFDEPNMYVYALTMNGRTQVGIAGTASTEEYEKGIVKKHEKTRKDKEDDRARHVMELQSQTGPVFLTYRDNAKINAIVKTITASKPYFSFTAVDGVKHEMWKCGEYSNELSEIFAKDVPCFYIADGHHRAASAYRASVTCKAKNPNHTGKEDYNFFLAVAFPQSELAILAYNRAVHDLNGLTEEEFVAKVSEKFTVAPTDNPQPPVSGTFCMYLGGKWYLLTPKFDVEKLDVISKLDVSVLQDNILAPILGIADPRTSTRIDFIGGIRGTKELERLAAIGKAVVCFSMYPTTLNQLMDIADAGAIMPPKSTWFEPKLRDGLVCHNFTVPGSKRTVVVIPARYGSSRFPGKALALLRGKPIIQWVWECAKKSKADDIYVATDDQRIFDAVVAFGGKAVMTSPNHPSGSDRIMEAVKNIQADVIVNVQGDEPSTPPELINGLIDMMCGDNAPDIGTVIVPCDRKDVENNPNKPKVVVDCNGNALYFSRSMIPFLREGGSEMQVYRHWGIYAYQRGALERFVSLPEGNLEKCEKLEQLRALENGMKIRTIKMNYDGIDVNTPEDLAEAEKLFASRGF